MIRIRWNHIVHIGLACIMNSVVRNVSLILRAGSMHLALPLLHIKKATNEILKRVFVIDVTSSKNL